MLACESSPNQPSAAGVFDTSNFMVVRPKTETLSPTPSLSPKRRPSLLASNVSSAEGAPAFDPFNTVDDEYDVAPDLSYLPKNEDIGSFDDDAYDSDDCSDEDTVSDIDDDCTLGAKGAIKEGGTADDASIDPQIVQRMECLLQRELSKTTVKKLGADKKEKASSSGTGRRKTTRRREGGCSGGAAGSSAAASAGGRHHRGSHPNGDSRSLQHEVGRVERIEVASRTSTSARTAPTTQGEQVKVQQKLKKQEHQHRKKSSREHRHHHHSSSNGRDHHHRDRKGHHHSHKSSKDQQHEGSEDDGRKGFQYQPLGEDPLEDTPPAEEKNGHVTPDT